MDIFLSWSGGQSRSVASAFRQWLPEVIPGVEPWMSEEDISKGKGWFTSLLDKLAEVRACVFCVTPQNVKSPWVFFEAGAVAAKTGDNHLFPYLVGVKGEAVSPTPLGQYQWTRCDKEDTWRLVKAVNRALGEKSHNEALLETQFNRKWRTLKQRLDAVLREQKEEEERDKQQQQRAPEAVFTPTPEEVDMLLKIADSDEGVIHYVKVGGGFQLLVGTDKLIQDNGPRAMARWQEAFDRLLRFGFLKDNEHNGERFHLSPSGYDVADKIRAHQRAKSGPDYAELERLMPELLAEMREDLNKQPLIREIVILDTKGNVYNGDDVFIYHRETHPQLDPKLQILVNHGLITDQTYNHVDRYHFTEEFVKYLTRASE